jgi:hypothetical protein
MSEMIKRVAKAMFRALDADPRFVGRADLTPEHPGWRQYCCQARAAIEAIREPTDDVLLAMYNGSLGVAGLPPVDELPSRSSANKLRAEWRAGVDAMLGNRP